MENQKKNIFRPKYKKMQLHQSKFGFVYDESQINYLTNIPELPDNPKPKPQEKNMNKKIKEIRDKIEKLKMDRKNKKEQYKSKTKDFKAQISTHTSNIQLGHKCIALLKEDDKKFEERLEKLENRIIRKKKTMEKFEKNMYRNQIKNVPIDEMSLQELKKEENRLLAMMSTTQLTKKQHNYYFNKITQINRLKLTADESKNQQNNEKKNIEDHIIDLKELQDQSKGIKNKLQETRIKIKCIEQDLQDFEEKIEIVQRQEANKVANKLYDESKDLKEKILAMRKEIEHVHTIYEQKVQEYQIEQQKIKWIKWANEIQQKIKEAWQKKKVDQKKKKFRAQQTGKKLTDKDEEKQDPKPKVIQKVFINQNQNQIDACSFLIYYCETLSVQQQKQDQKKQTQLNVESELKKGDWGSLKGMEVIKQKKLKNDDEIVSKNKKKKVEKNIINENRFSHTFNVAQLFDSVKVLPPTSTQELESTIKQLKDKLQYYTSHPNQINKKSNDERGKYTEQKYNNTKRMNTKKIINSEDFPTLK